MSGFINIEGNKKQVKSIYGNVNGTIVNAKSLWVNKNGSPVCIYTSHDSDDTKIICRIGDKILYCNDQQNFIESSLSSTKWPSTLYQCLYYGNGTFVAAYNGGCYYSIDTGITWHECTIPSIITSSSYILMGGTLIKSLFYYIVTAKLLTSL